MTTKRRIKLPRAGRPDPIPESLVYPYAVIDGEVEVCEAVRQMCQQAIEDYEVRQHDPDFPYFYDQRQADAALAFYRSFPFTIGVRATRNEKFDPEPWQAFFLASIEAWREKENPRVRRFKVAILFVGRKNGKTMMSALMALRELYLGDSGGEVYSIAVNMKQARVGFEAGCQMIQKMGNTHPFLHNTTVGRDQIEVRRGRVPRRWQYLSRNWKGADGRNASLSIVDEAASLEDRRLPESLTFSGRGRESPLTLFCSTAQPVYESLFLEQCNILRTSLKGGARADNYFGLLYEVDRAHAGESDEEVFQRIATTPSLWSHANPNLGVSIYRGALELELQDAAVNVGKRPEILLKTHNVYAAPEAAWMSVDAWDAMPYAELDGPAVAALDLGLRGDLTGFCILFNHGTGRVSALTRSYAPREAYARVTEDVRQVFDKAIESGALTIMGENTLDKEALLEEVKALCAEHGVTRVALDPWRSNELYEALDRSALQPVTVKQGPALTPATFHLEELIANNALRHEHCEFMRWQVSNVQRREMSGGRVALEKSGVHRKIDAVAALQGAVMISLHGENQIAGADVTPWEDIPMAGADAELGGEGPAWVEEDDPLRFERPPSRLDAFFR